MGRKTTVWTATEGRDHGKRFHLTEMSALKAEKWAARALLALARADFDVGTDIRGSGLAGMALVGLRALSGVQWVDAEPLLDELLRCVLIMPDNNNPDVMRSLVEDDIEEVATLVQLRKEVFELHVNFSWSEIRSKLTLVSELASQGSAITPMSQESLAK